MYKTVRQGEASLHYTILPQIDQFYVNEMSLVRSSGTAAPPPPNTPAKMKYCNSVCDPFDLSSTLMSYLGFRTIALFICFGIGIYFIEQMGGNICSGNPCRATASMTKKIFLTENNIDKDYEIQNDLTDSLMTSTNESNFSKTFDHHPEPADSIDTSSLDLSTEGVKINHSETTIDAETDFLMSRESSTKSSSRLDIESTTLSPMIDVTSVLSEELKVDKMPRVTLKLRKNETIPQMYMNSGIASYKKGNITTSVLAQRLSLEGLIFKTPEGTIKPWREKWPFKDNSVVFQQLKHGILRKDLIMFGMLIFLTALLVMMALLLLTVSRRQWHLIEEIDVEIQDDSSSNLLSVQCQDPIDKE